MVITAREGGTEPGLQAVWLSFLCCGPQNREIAAFPKACPDTTASCRDPGAKEHKKNKRLPHLAATLKVLSHRARFFDFPVIPFQIRDLLALTIDAH